MIKKVIERILNLQHRGMIEGKGQLSYHPLLTHFIVSRGARMKLGGTLRIGANSYGNNGRSNLIRMDRGGRIHVNGDFMFMYGADVTVFRDGVLELGADSFINSDCKIRCFKHIAIGDGCKIAHDFTVLDSDAHQLDNELKTKEVLIGNHVWIGTRVTILKGTVIGDGCMIAAGAVVTGGVFPPNSLIGGVPAKVIKTGIEWRG